MTDSSTDRTNYKKKYLELHRTVLALRTPLETLQVEANKLQDILGVPTLKRIARAVIEALYSDPGSLSPLWPYCPECQHPVTKITYVYNRDHGSVHRLVQCHGQVLNAKQQELNPGV